ncbi:hypothetical protein GWK47_054262 [Chionoecetes opilio]|uniref:Uncharacterized protein n=1 Tax=Chionoecetes opilio TaxID=41210 RepID=A0A8J4Y760_CHIOP|nr:hypothetical protein GWK47_054262 [Chionoecetes opilio]
MSGAHCGGDTPRRGVHEIRSICIADIPSRIRKVFCVESIAGNIRNANLSLNILLLEHALNFLKLFVLADPARASHCTRNLRAGRTIPCLSVPTRATCSLVRPGDPAVMRVCVTVLFLAALFAVAAAATYDRAEACCVRRGRARRVGDPGLDCEDRDAVMCGRRPWQESTMRGKHRWEAPWEWCRVVMPANYLSGGGPSGIHVYGCIFFCSNLWVTTARTGPRNECRDAPQRQLIQGAPRPWRCRGVPQHLNWPGRQVLCSPKRLYPRVMFPATQSVEAYFVVAFKAASSPRVLLRT